MPVLDRLTAALADRYAIEREIGEGGMATVYRARDVRHERPVAIKVLHPELSAMLGPDRFLSEIKLTASLQHPNILPLFDSGVADGLLYYVMPFVDGETLRRRLERERQLPIADAVRLATEIADALHYAHEHGVVHRDIKPENVLLQSGRAVVADFGIALAVQHAGGTRMTQTGMSLGTPQYMAPEQAMGERQIDARADIYALGAVTYEMLAGEPPFTGPTAQAIVARVMTERSRPLRAVRDTVPEHIERGVATALEKLPADRFASAALFAASLDRANATSVPYRSGADPAPRAGAGRAALRTALLAAIALITGVVIGAKVINRVRGPVQPATELALRFTVTPPDSVRLRLVCCGQMFVISPNGRWLVFQGTQGDGNRQAPTLDHYQLYVRDLTDLSTRALPGTTDAVGLFFSPNSSELGFVTGRELKRMPLSGADAQTIATLPDGFIGGASWGSDDIIVVAVSGLVLQVPSSGGVPTPLFARDTAGFQFTGPQRWPREQVVLYTRASQGGEPEIEWRSLASNRVKTVVPGATPVYLEATRALLVVRGDGALMQYPFDVTTGDTTGPGVRIASDVVRRSPILAHGEYSVSTTGTVLLATRRSTAVRGVALVRLGATPTVTRAMEDFVAFTNPMFSPKGDKVAVLAARDMGNYALQLYDVARGVTARAPVEGEVAAVGWTATGDSVVYRVGNHTYFVRAVNGSGAPTPALTVRDWTSASSDGLSAWGPWIAFSGVQRGAAANIDIAIAHRDSLGAARAYTATAFNELEPAISPDGKWMAYTSEENGREDVWVSAFPVAAGRYLVSTAGGRTPHWSRDARTLYFTNGSSVFAVAFSPGAPPTIGAARTLYTRDPWGSFSISPDGTTMLTTDRVREGQPQSLVVNVRAVVQP
jgi:eukaryotic-like serine/threonine-protein kinase